ncbi:signal transduction histidine kinase [Caldalkalibacillus uzonensis]|uniref:histidine kinase n=1 Tax=Caldalkalibacillus uzonensis TaxID=353224 RepID=A0ABU0CYC1_9BACI|nr:sensor histidine kinase [Caldalkalibacillus uzonensis]MDQ0341149.1 signal transduction histidine kinase [Caldalkalibacillus uzonensis]
MAKFRTRARAVDLLGKEQIRDEITAISELLRNSYDADATEGLIKIDTEKDRIIVWDDGEGMTERELQENWLTLGTYSKRHQGNRKSKKGRVKIGEKGIGRLAISLLGDLLLLVSKKEGGNWSVLFLHWELFRNPDIYLEDIEIPIRTFNTYEEVVHYLTTDMSDMKKVLQSNLTNSDGWTEKDILRITEDIQKFKVGNELLNRLRINEKRGKGTTFYIARLESFWDWGVYLRTRVKDENIEKRIQRLKDVLFSFQNFIDLFDMEDANGRHLEESFKPQIEINGQKLTDEAWFNPDDLKLYDYALKGTIDENAVFHGVAYVGNDKEEVTVGSDDLLQGMYSEGYESCGPIKIKWYFVEGQESQSRLTKEQHKTMIQKLNKIGGIYVFRDGLRILPYGEPGNDFLYIEERRSRGAGYYLFSHRRMFGYIEISKKKNPHLVDKSSREGFVENSYYNYFRGVAINLLKWWAIDYLETQKKEMGKRYIYLERIRKEKEREERLNEKKKKEEKRKRDYFKRLETELDNFDEKLANERARLKRVIDEEIEDWIGTSQNNVSDRMGWKNRLYELGFTLHKKVDGIRHLRIEPNLRYVHDNEMLDIIEEKSQALDKAIEELNGYIESAIKNAEKRMSEITAKSVESGTNENETVRSLERAIRWCNTTSKEMIAKIEEESSSTFNEQVEEMNRKLKNYFLSEVSRHEKMLAPLNDELQTIKQDLLAKHQQWQSSNLLTDIDKLEKETQEVLSNFESLTERLQKNILDYSQELRNNQAAAFVKRLSENLDEIYEDYRNNETDEAFIGLLKKEIELYRDLSAVGLAAELTSHEFNHLYNRIRENLDIMLRASRNKKTAAIVENTLGAFRSLEKLHQRISPLYRQTRYRRREIDLRAFLESVIEYFSTDVKKYGIETVYDIPKGFYIKEADPVLFTPLVNLVSNAIYWMLNSDRREIHFYTSNDLDCLYVHDTGHGISDRDRERIFEPFFTKKIDGRGLGLYLSRDILKTKGHKLYLVPAGKELKPLGGACFCIEFHPDCERGIKGEEIL